MSETKELWRKQVGHISFYAYEHDGIETIVGKIEFSVSRQFTLHEKEMMRGDLEAITRQQIITTLDTDLDAAVAQFHKDIHG